VQKKIKEIRGKNLVMMPVGQDAPPPVISAVFTVQIRIKPAVA